MSGNVALAVSILIKCGPGSYSTLIIRGLGRQYSTVYAVTVIYFYSGVGSQHTERESKHYTYLMWTANMFNMLTATEFSE